jgi:hypothetical protein
MILIVGILYFQPEPVLASSSSAKSEIGVTFVEGTGHEESQDTSNMEQKEGGHLSKPNGSAWGNLPSMGEQQLIQSVNLLGAVFIGSFFLLWKMKKREVNGND